MRRTFMVERLISDPPYIHEDGLELYLALSRQMSLLVATGKKRTPNNCSCYPFTGSARQPARQPNGRVGAHDQVGYGCH